MYTVGPRSVRVISRELATPPLLAAAAFSGPARPPGLALWTSWGGCVTRGDPATVVCVRRCRCACAGGTQGFVARANGLPLGRVGSPSPRVAHQSGTSSVVAGSVRD